MITAEECYVYKEFVDKYQSYLYPLIGARLSRLYPNIKGVIVDMGTGPGYLSIQLANRTGAKVHAVDINPAMHEIAKKEVEKKGIVGEIQFDIEDVHNMSYQDNFTDFIVSYSCLHHWEDVVKALKECYRVLAPGGRIVILDTMKVSDDYLASMEKLVTEPEYFRFVREAFEESYSLEEIHKFVELAGIENYKLESFNFEPEDFIEAMDELEDSDVWNQELNIVANNPVNWILIIEK